MTACIEVSLFRSLPTALLAFLLCLLLFLVGVLFVSSSGIYWVNLLDTFAGTVSLFLVALCEVLAVVLHYDFRNLVVLRQNSESCPPSLSQQPSSFPSCSAPSALPSPSPPPLLPVPTPSSSSYSPASFSASRQDRTEQQQATEAKACQATSADEASSPSTKTSTVLVDSYNSNNTDDLLTCAPPSPGEGIQLSASSPITMGTPGVKHGDLSWEGQSTDLANHGMTVSNESCASTSSTQMRRGSHFSISAAAPSSSVDFHVPTPESDLFFSSSSPVSSCSPSPTSRHPLVKPPHHNQAPAAAGAASPSGDFRATRLHHPVTSSPLVTAPTLTTSPPPSPSPCSSPRHPPSSDPPYPRVGCSTSPTVSQTMKTKRLQLFSFFLLSSPHLRRFLTLVLPPFLWLLTLCGLIWFASPSSPHAGLGQRQRDIRGLGCLGSPSACSGHGRCVLCDEELEALAPTVLDELSRKTDASLSGPKLLQVSEDGRSVEEEDEGEEPPTFVAGSLSKQQQGTSAAGITEEAKEEEKREKETKGEHVLGHHPGKEEGLLLGDQSSLPEKIGSLLHAMKRDRKENEQGSEDEIRSKGKTEDPKRHVDEEDKKAAATRTARQNERNETADSSEGREGRRRSRRLLDCLESDCFSVEVSQKEWKEKNKRKAAKRRGMRTDSQKGYTDTGESRAERGAEEISLRSEQGGEEEDQLVVSLVNPSGSAKQKAFLSRLFHEQETPHLQSPQVRKLGVDASSSPGEEALSMGRGKTDSSPSLSPSVDISAEANTVKTDTAHTSVGSSPTDATTNEDPKSRREDDTLAPPPPHSDDRRSADVFFSQDISSKTRDGSPSFEGKDGEGEDEEDGGSRRRRRRREPEARGECRQRPPQEEENLCGLQYVFLSRWMGRTRLQSKLPHERAMVSRGL